MLLALLACVAPRGGGGAEPYSCDARTLAPGEVRVRQVPCNDELIDGGEGRIGDWLIENAVARFVVRGTYASLTRLDEAGGTLIDAASVGGTDLLSEYIPQGDRSAISAVQGDGYAELVLPGVTWHLDADSDALLVSAADGTLQGLDDAERTGATLTDGDTFFGADGAATGEGFAVAVSGVTRLAVSDTGLWPDGVEVTETVDADFVRVSRAGAEVRRVAVADGQVSARVPVDATLTGERDGCAYEGLVSAGCGSLRIRVADDLGGDLSAVLTDGLDTWRVPRGGGSIPLGPSARDLWLWAGPAYGVARVHFPGGDASHEVTLFREWDPGEDVLAAPLVTVAPGADAIETPEAASTRLAGEGVGFAVMVADDEVPLVTTDVHDGMLAVAASRAGGIAWSWPWSPNSKRAAHGAVPWAGLGATDMLAVSEGGESKARLTVVDAAWVAEALGESPPQDWDPRPDAMWLDGLGDLPTYLALLDAWLDVAPLGPRTWIGMDAAHNVPAVEAGIVDGRTTAGTGARLTLTTGHRAPVGTWVEVTLDCASWMRMRTVTLWTSAGARAIAVEGRGTTRWIVPEGTTWVVATAEGDVASPGSAEPAWAVSGALWL